MLYFIPAWYKQNMWCENEQQWYMRRLKSEFDETIKQITLFHRNVDRPYRILVLGYSPNFRHFLHRQGMYRSKYWSCFDAIAQVRRKKVAVLSYHDIKWPKGLEFVYSPFSIIALQGDVKYAQVEFGEDGNPISIDMFEDGKICRRNYYDDRGFVSSTVIYENGIEQYQDFLMENGIWKIREYKNDGHVVVNQTCPDYDVVPDAKSGKAGEPVEMRFTKAEYDSLEAVIEEVFASYVNLTRQNDNFFVAMHPLHIRVAEHVLKGKRIIATFFENRFDFTQTSLAADFLEHAENIITDSDYTTKLIMENLGAVNNKPFRLHITDIPPYDTRMDFGISSQLRVQNILVPVDGLTKDAFAQIVEDIDYIEEDKAVWLTPKGVKFAESFFGISNFYGKENFEINRHVTLSLRAHKLLKNKKDYVVTDKKEVELFDGATGRLMHGVKLRGGQHQAIEAKEKVEISQEYRTVASVTFQNLFMMFDKMAGMSGTLMDAKDELFETYGKHVVRIPTNRPLKRVDRKDRYFKNGHDQFWTAVDDVIRLHETGQPVLVVLNSVTDTDLFSRLLIEKNIPHNVLNASNAFWEAQIIAGAGQLNAVTVATTMAGRGTDIKLGDGVKELGGLAVIGIGRMNNSRSERQARGRAGRQGDPGFSQYYVSLEDDIVGAEDDDKLQRYIDGKKRIGKRKIKRIVNQCQKEKDANNS